MKKCVVVSVMLAAFVSVAGDLSIGGLDFVAVDGTSQLPLEFMRTGESREKLSPMKLSRFWISEKPVSEALFLKVMGRPSSGCNSERPMVNIEWSEACEFCERFTRANMAQMPTNCVASLPHMIEWAHAVRVLKGKTDFGSSVGTYLFTGSSQGGYLHTMGADILAKCTNADLSVDLLITPKRLKRDNVGIRVVLIDVTEEVAGWNRILDRGMVALQHGEFALATQYIQLALARGRLNEQDKGEAEKALSWIRQGHDEDQEDWSGLVAISAAFAEKRGFQTQPFAENWQTVGWEDSENEKVAKAYEKAGIVGKWMKISDLPKPVKADQNPGREYGLMVLVSNELETVEMKVEPDYVVQALECDFDSDGRKDLVTEVFDEAASTGYQYNFYRCLADGSYTNVLVRHVAGLCALPRRDGKGCGFLVVDKNSNPVLSVSLLTFKGEEHITEEANQRPFYMLDAREDQIYGSAPFIGAGYGLGWMHLRARGIWYRPLYWPWKSGKMQGYEKALKLANEKPKIAGKEKE